MFRHTGTDWEVSFEHVDDRAASCHLARALHPLLEQARNDPLRLESEADELVQLLGVGHLDDVAHIGSLRAALNDTTPDVRAAFRTRFGIANHGPHWWLTRRHDQHGDNCVCRPATLLDVLLAVVPEEQHQVAVDTHQRAMTEAWSHFWNGQGLWEGGCGDVVDVCPQCVSEGLSHVWSVHNEARSYGEDLAEVIAAYHTTVSVGSTRYERK